MSLNTSRVVGFGEDKYYSPLEEWAKDYPHITEQRWAVDHVLDVEKSLAARA